MYVYDQRQHNIDFLRHELGTFDWNNLFENCSDCLTNMYGEFIKTVNKITDHCIPQKAVKLGPRDPAYFTPLIKHLLVQRNRYMRRGNIGKADELSSKLNLLVAEARSRHMAKLSNADTKSCGRLSEETVAQTTKITSIILELLMHLTLILLVLLQTLTTTVTQ